MTVICTVSMTGTRAFRWIMTLNKAADHRLEGAMAGGYADDRIPGEGTINDYLSVINYRRSASCLELYVRDCEDASEALINKGKLDKNVSSQRPTGSIPWNITAAWGWPTGKGREAVFCGDF